MTKVSDFHTGGAPNMRTEEMIEHLEQYFEAAGFENVYDRLLKGMSAEAVQKMYSEIEKEV